MPAYYRSSLAEFIAEEPQAVVGQLHIKYEKDGFAEQYLTQTRAWAELVPLLQVELQTLVKQVPGAGSWAILLELPLHRLQRRIDIIARCLRRCPLFCVPCTCQYILVQTRKYAGRAGLAGTSGRAPKSEWSGIGPHAPLWGSLAPGHVVPFNVGISKQLLCTVRATPQRCVSQLGTTSVLKVR